MVFLLQTEGQILPVEVKYGSGIRAKSLMVYRSTHAPFIALRFSPRNLSFESGLLDLPLFMAGNLTTLLKAATAMPLAPA